MPVLLESMITNYFHLLYQTNVKGFGVFGGFKESFNVNTIVHTDITKIQSSWRLLKTFRPQDDNRC